MRHPLQMCVALGACLLAGINSVEASPIYLTGNSAGFTTSTVGAVTFADFDAPVNPAYATISGGVINGGSNPGAGGNWLSANGDAGSPGEVTITFTGLQDYFGLYLESNDFGDNRVNVFNGMTLLATFDGYDIVAHSTFFNITAGNAEALFDRITLTDPYCCFEVDNLAGREAAQTPEPASLLLLGTGLAAVAGRRLTKRRS